VLAPEVEEPPETELELELVAVEEGETGPGAVTLGESVLEPEADTLEVELPLDAEPEPDGVAPLHMTDWMPSAMVRSLAVQLAVRQALARVWNC